ncbi:MULTISPECIES: redox-sensing transcriptional repressor Rex [Tissierellales]|jgi:redox-sensing transcriptional repressor|uniref:Redox-sensing transcriptional repressor Rex n=1 Tax=Acidilutibacter cellobiosedens TaxID=2507161 RepID=A0A410Q9W1_9FIRM|nr:MULTISPECIES: redox-sensing transcriptional repressor Rex [Tissierellales]MBE6081601.1 redox-sensing transcriptional repressor Rex [Tissierellaceae bacterium]QAT60766.1 redox-sensing transcriptional repressor Rex [Acidilutibacter cellobiosedens]SCL87558.1 Redox-sensing transcriptional repressor rex [Sporanaerobacter sp. PP17-6a]
MGNKVSITVIRRLPKYYRYLGELLNKGIARISSQELSTLTGFTASQIRQDLNNFGGFGQQGYGYNVSELYRELGKILGLDKVYNAVIAGAGNLGQAVANYRGFEDAGFKVLSLFDKNPKIIGLKIRDIEIRDVDLMENFIKENNVEIGIITTPKENAQDIANTYAKSGLRGIWNFAPADLKVPENIVVENVHLNESLFILSYFLKRNLGGNSH